MDIKQIVLDLCALSDEQEWFEFKENWFQPEALTFDSLYNLSKTNIFMIIID